MLVVRTGDRIGPGNLAYVDPDAELIVIRPGLPPQVESEVLRQAAAGMIGRWDLAPDTEPAPTKDPHPHLRLVADLDADDEAV